MIWAASATACGHTTNHSASKQEQQSRDRPWQAVNDPSGGLGQDGNTYSHEDEFGADDASMPTGVSPDSSTLLATESTKDKKDSYKMLAGLSKRLCFLAYFIQSSASREACVDCAVNKVDVMRGGAKELEHKAKNLMQFAAFFAKTIDELEKSLGVREHGRASLAARIEVTEGSLGYVWTYGKPPDCKTKKVLGGAASKKIPMSLPRRVELLRDLVERGRTASVDEYLLHLAHSPRSWVTPAIRSHARHILKAASPGRIEELRHEWLGASSTAGLPELLHKVLSTRNPRAKDPNRLLWLLLALDKARLMHLRANAHGSILQRP